MCCIGMIAHVPWRDLIIVCWIHTCTDQIVDISLGEFDSTDFSQRQPSWSASHSSVLPPTPRPTFLALLPRMYYILAGPRMYKHTHLKRIIINKRNSHCSFNLFETCIFCSHSAKRAADTALMHALAQVLVLYRLASSGPAHALAVCCRSLHDPMPGKPYADICTAQARSRGCTPTRGQTKTHAPACSHTAVSCLSFSSGVSIHERRPTVVISLGRGLHLLQASPISNTRTSGLEPHRIKSHDVQDMNRI